MKTYSKNTCVEWNWGPGKASGRVQEVFCDRVTRTIKGSEITRDASSDNPAYLIKQDDGDRVLKSHSELHKKS